MENSIKISGPDLLNFVEMFEAAEQATDIARQQSERCRDYYDNKQWTSEETQELARRGQPAIVDNVIAGKINWLIGNEINRRTDPKAFPRTPQHQQGAEAATDSIRFVCDANDFDRVKSGVWENMLIEGYGGCEVIHKRNKAGGFDIVINRYSWDRLFYDPHSKEDDFSDARYLGAVIWMDIADAKLRWPDVADELDATMAQGNTEGETYEDRPHYELWGDRARNRVRICLMWYREKGVWKWVRFTKGTTLEEGDSPYVDEDGDSVCPLVMQSAYVDRENRRYGEVLKLLDQQDEINKRRSKLLHLLSSRQFVYESGAFNSVEKVRKELARPDGIVELQQPDARFDLLNTTDMTAGQFQLLQEAKRSIQDMGATEALQGAAAGDSGRAVLAKQQGAMQALTPLTDKLNHFARRVYEAIWNRVRQFWTEEKWIRVTDNERNVRFVGLNQPVTLADRLQQIPPDQARAFAMQNGLRMGDPRLNQVIDVENNVESLEVDIIIDEVPDAVTLEAETFEQIVNIDTARGGVLPLDMIIEASPLRSDKKQRILDWIEEQKQQQAQAQQAQAEDPRAVEAYEIQKAEKMAGIQKTQSETEENAAQVEKMRAETAMKMAEARQAAMMPRFQSIRPTF